MSVSGLRGIRNLLLDTNGDGTGSFEMAIDGSTTPQTFFRAPPDKITYWVTKAVVIAASNNWNRANEYGAAGTLDVGIEVYAENEDNVRVDFTEEHKVVDWNHWAVLAGLDRVISGGAGADALVVSWEFFPGEFELVGDQGDLLAMKINDDLSSLIYQHAMIQVRAFPTLL